MLTKPWHQTISTSKIITNGYPSNNCEPSRSFFMFLFLGDLFTIAVSPRLFSLVVITFVCFRCHFSCKRRYDCYISFSETMSRCLAQSFSVGGGVSVNRCHLMTPTCSSSLGLFFLPTSPIVACFRWSSAADDHSLLFLRHALLFLIIGIFLLCSLDLSLVFSGVSPVSLIVPVVFVFPIFDGLLLISSK
jgi:hypothetical protein